MINKLKIKIITLIEDNPDKNYNLYNEHGLSLYIEVNGINILFDTGKSGKFIENAKKLNVNLDNLQYVILSHGHYDHSGGFRKLTKEVEKSYKLIVGKEFFNYKYKVKGEHYKYNGNSFNEDFINKNNISFKYVQDSFHINDNIIIFTNFRTDNNFEFINENLKIRQGKSYVADTFSDEIVLGIKTDKGIIVILGCSHVGIVNILKQIESKGNSIYGIIGGTHLIEADELRLNKTIEFLKERHIRFIGISHCTGEKATEKIKSEFEDEFIYNNTGNIITIT